MLLKLSLGLKENIAVLEFIVKFILKFIVKSILQVYFTSLFYRTPPDDCFCRRFSDILFVGMWNIWKVSLLVTVHSFLLELFSTDLLIFFGMFLVMCQMIFCLMIFNTLSYYCYLSSWLFHF